MSTADIAAETRQALKSNNYVERRRGDDRRKYDRVLKSAIAAWMSAGQTLRTNEDVFRIAGRDVASAYRSIAESGR